ncbi:3-oxoacyl-[acyl-carrier-protein] synthase-3 [Saccharopolyspora antimicrobica]|uniref:3-oxoacyl-[acyl-carrier-protein] synthase-3 n=1 Tax=Saccharopolyspora antimicrobica TaxID=455193 RepID=A0A1I5AXY9_9PSEU|nr:ketoacyl-ACP synthase III family protein [Saccharopolyspora antimicrobica]RKT86397.1 3-oxoacyl-[acyl-carrier-protein] synthase-3 [Saccharopolyspora antimicrobica]SFN67089.1 3-oxoacyl-[acyl-carrier-protein] synthase-3 [Saccharopolyspora antimicrobica]
MRHHGITLHGIGAVAGDLVTSIDAIRDGHYSAEQAHRNRQDSTAVAAGRTGPELAAQAGRQAMHAAERDVDLHLHATIHDPGLDFWSAASFVAHQTGITPMLTLSINAMSNSMIAGLQLAAGVLEGHAGHSALLTAGDVFEPPLFDRWQTDAGIVYGDAGTALLLHRDDTTPAIADVLSTASESHPSLEALHRGNSNWHSGHTYRPPIQLRTRKAQFLATHGGGSSIEGTNTTAVSNVLKTALYQAEIELNDLARILCPHYGNALTQRHCLTPLGIPEERTTAFLGRWLGHMGASDQITDLHYLLTRGLLNPGDHVALLGIGVGMTWTAAILRIH